NLAKRVQQTPLDQLAVPQTATFRQLPHLDDERAALDQRNATQNEERHDNCISIQATLRINISGLRHALGLPDINLNGLVNFDAGILARPEGDLRDVDHEDGD
ncbi:hypothetical protein BG015_006735, partial [Linnemannia schmuckeri]